MHKDKIKNIITEYLIEKPEIILAYIFGSFFKKNIFHDLDIGIYLSEEFNKNDFNKYPYGYESYLISELSLKVRMKVDVVIMNNSNLLLQQRIINNGILLFSKNDNFRVFYENTIRKNYIDAEPLRKIKSYYLSRKIENAGY